MEADTPEDIRPQLECYKDPMRICGPACMAYLVLPPAGPAYQGQNWAHCLELVNNDRIGRHLTVIAQNLAGGSQKKRLEEAQHALQTPR